MWLEFWVSVPSRGEESNNTKKVTQSPLQAKLTVSVPSRGEESNNQRTPTQSTRTYGMFPSPLGVKSPTIALTKHAEYDY